VEKHTTSLDLQSGVKVYGAIGLYTYYERLSQDLRQPLAGARKFGLEYIAALTPMAARVSGIPLVSDQDKEEVGKILG